jgi:mediator of RNA polymerase II transcription subunit 7
MEDTQEAELRNPFPSPPSHYTNYTAHNLQLLSLLKECTEGQYASELTQTEILSDQNDVPEWPLISLEKPRVDWIREEGYYDVFGDRWFVRLAQYSIASEVMYDPPSSSKRQSHLLERWAVISCTQRTPPQVRCFCCCLPLDLKPPTNTLLGSDRRLALLSILKSMLVTYSSFLGALLAPPPITSSAPPEWHRQVEWITILAQNVMAAANDLRPVQVRSLRVYVYVGGGFMRGFVSLGTREP